MENHFVSVLGPDQVPTSKKDVRFRKIVAPEFQLALAESKSIEAGRSLVVYRLSYSSEDDKFYSSRQFKLDPAGGHETYDDELGKDHPSPKLLCYELYSVADELVSSPDLGAMIGDIRKLSNQPKPGNGKP